MRQTGFLHSDSQGHAERDPVEHDDVQNLAQN
jgi:hypothetical protein